MRRGCDPGLRIAPTLALPRKRGRERNGEEVMSWRWGADGGVLRQVVGCSGSWWWQSSLSGDGFVIPRAREGRGYGMFLILGLIYIFAARAYRAELRLAGGWTRPEM